MAEYNDIQPGQNLLVGLVDIWEDWSTLTFKVKGSRSFSVSGATLFASNGFSLDDLFASDSVLNALALSAFRDIGHKDIEGVPIAYIGKSDRCSFTRTLAAGMYTIKLSAHSDVLSYDKMTYKTYRGYEMDMTDFMNEVGTSKISRVALSFFAS